MEAEDNSACAGSPCLPTVSGVSFSPTGFYYGGSPEIKSSSSITVNASPTAITETMSGSCTITYQFSTDGTNYKYWDGASWSAVASNANANSIADINANIASLTTWPSSLYFKAFMASDSTQSCSLDELSVTYNQ